MSKHIFMAYDSGGIKMNDEMLFAAKNSLVFDFSRNSIYTQQNEFGYTDVVCYEVPAHKITDRKLITNVYKDLDGKIAFTYTSLGNNGESGIPSGRKISDYLVTGPSTYADVLVNISQDGLGQISYTYSRIYTAHSTRVGEENLSGNYVINSVSLSENGELSYTYHNLVTTENDGKKSVQDIVLGNNDVNVITGINQTKDGKITYSYSNISVNTHTNTGAYNFGENFANVVTNVNLSEDGHFTYSYHPIAVHTEPGEYKELVSENVTSNSQISVLNISSTNGKSKATKIITDASLKRDGLTTILHYTYSYIYSDSNHHSYLPGIKGNDIEITYRGENLISGVTLSPDGVLSYTYSNYTVKNSKEAETLTYLLTAYHEYDPSLYSVVNVNKNGQGRITIVYTDLTTEAPSSSTTTNTDNSSYFNVIDNISQSRTGKITYTVKTVNNTHTNTPAEGRSNYIISNVNLSTYGNFTYTYFDSTVTTGEFTNQLVHYSSHQGEITGDDVPPKKIRTNPNDSFALVNGIKQSSDGQISYSYIDLYAEPTDFVYHMFSLDNTHDYLADDIQDNVVQVIKTLGNDNNNVSTEHTILHYSTVEVPTKKYLDNLLQANDALRYCGTVTASTTENGEITLVYHSDENTSSFSSENPDKSKGAVYKVTNIGFIGTQRVSPGDMIISYSDDPLPTTVNPITGWDVINENIDLRQDSEVTTNSELSNIVLTNTHLYADGQLTYSFAPVEIFDIPNKIDTNLVGTVLSGSNTQNIVSINDTNIGIPVVTSVRASYSGLRHTIVADYTYIYASQNHHQNSGSQKANGTTVITNVVLSNDGKLTYTFNNETVVTYTGVLNNSNTPITNSITNVNILHDDKTDIDNVGYNVITGIRLDRKQNEISLTYEYTSIYASQNHHTFEGGSQASNIVIDEDGEKLVSGIYYDQYGRLSYAYSDVTVSYATVGGTLKTINSVQLESYTYSVVNIYKDSSNGNIVTYSYVDLTTEDGTFEKETTIKEEEPLNIITSIKQRGDGKISYAYQIVNIASLWERGIGTNTVQVINSGANANSSYGVVAGYFLTANAFVTGESAFGRYNVSTENHTIHSIGIGYYSTDINAPVRQNAIEIFDNGDFYVYGLGYYDGKDTTNAIPLQRYLDTVGVWEKGQGTYSVQVRNTQSYALGDYSLASGRLSYAYGQYAIAEGYQSYALGSYATSIGRNSYAIGENSFATGYNTYAIGKTSSSSGYFTYAYGEASHTEGKLTYSLGSYSHAEGAYTYATANQAHAEGWQSRASGVASHAEGWNNIASGVGAHAEGGNFEEGGNTASGFGSHAEGQGTHAVGAATHAEGNYTTAHQQYSHAEGNHSYTLGAASHAEGEYTYTYNPAEHSEGRYNLSHKENTTFGNAYNTIHTIGIGGSNTNRKNAVAVMQNGDFYVYGLGNYDGTNPKTSYTLQQFLTTSGVWERGKGFVSVQTKESKSQANGAYSAASGYSTYAFGAYSFATGNSTYALGESSFTEGAYTYAYGSYSHAEGYLSYAVSVFSHAEGNKTLASGIASHAEGSINIASGNGSHAEGNRTTASYNCSHAEGTFTLSAGQASHAEGYYSYAIRSASHAEGHYTYSFGINSHTEGSYTYTDSPNSHAEGYLSYATGQASHAEGYSSHSYNISEHSEGQFNISHTGDGSNTTWYGSPAYTVSSIGIGTADNSRKNAFEVMQNGDIYIYNIGNYDGTNPQTASSLQSYLITAGVWERGSGILSVQTKETSAYSFGNYSVASGRSTYSYNFAEHSEGQFNVSHTGAGSNSTWYGSSAYTVSSIGIGTADNSRKNAIEVMQNGDIYVYNLGNYDGTNPETASTLQSYLTTAGVWERGNGILSVQTKETSSYSLGDYALASGYFTYASNRAESSFGQYNVSKNYSSQPFGYQYNTIHSVGVGYIFHDTDNNEDIEVRKNALEITQNGELYLLGIGDYDGTNSELAYSLREVIIEDELIISYAFNDLDQRIDLLQYTFDTIPGAVFERGSGTGSIQQTDSGSTATGTYSFTVGQNCITSGNYSTTIGQNSVNSGAETFSFGIRNQVSSNAAFVAGESNDVSGQYGNVVLGTSNKTNREGTVLLGDVNITYSPFTFVLGRYNTFDNYSSSSTSIGYMNSFVESQYSIALSSISTIENSNYSTVLGYSNSLTASDYSTLIGTGNEVENSLYSTTIGRNCFTGANYGITIGYNNSNEGLYGIALGRDLIISEDNEIAIGKFNSSSDSVFELGIGVDSSNRKNAFEVDSAGDLYLFGVGEYIGNNKDDSKSLQLYLEENERTISEALNDLNNRILNLNDTINQISSSPFEYGTGTLAIQSIGTGCSATGHYSFSEGYNTLARNNYEIALGAYNSSTVTNASEFGNAGNTMFSVGIGNSTSNRKNALEIAQNGNIYLLGVGNYNGENLTGNNTLSLQQVLSSISSVATGFTFALTTDSNGNDVITLTIGGVSHSITLTNSWGNVPNN